MVVIALVGASLFAIESGKANRNAEKLWKKIGINVGTAIVVSFFLLMVFVFSELSGIIFEQGAKPLVTDIRSKL